MNDNEMVHEAAPETHQQESIETQENDSSEVVASQQSKDSSKDENMRALREKAEKLQRQNEEYLRMLQEVQYASQQQQKQPEAPEVDPSDDDLVEGKHYKRLANDLREVKRQAYEMAVESRIRNQFPDFDSVVNLDTIKALREAEPELASSLHVNPDFLAKAVGTYKAIKRLGIMPASEFDADKALAQKNAAKPRTVTSISPQQGESPLSRANAFAHGLTPELSKQLLKEMEEARKRY